MYLRMYYYIHAYSDYAYKSIRVLWPSFEFSLNSKYDMVADCNLKTCNPEALVKQEE